MIHAGPDNDTGTSPGIVTAMVREAAHLTRRHGRHEGNIQWFGGPTPDDRNAREGKGITEAA